jgi:hypothetical protein
LKVLCWLYNVLTTFRLLCIEQELTQHFGGAFLCNPSFVRLTT